MARLQVNKESFKNDKGVSGLRLQEPEGSRTVYLRELILRMAVDVTATGVRGSQSDRRRRFFSAKKPNTGALRGSAFAEANWAPW